MWGTDFRDDLQLQQQKNLFHKSMEPSFSTGSSAQNVFREAPHALGLPLLRTVESSPRSLECSGEVCPIYEEELNILELLIAPCVEIQRIQVR
jgi:hypothetical protein